MTLFLFLGLAAGVAVILCAIMAMAWRTEQTTGNAGWVDTFWSFGLGIAGVLVSLAAILQTQNWRPFLIAGLIAAWSLRLGLHILARTRRGHDDPRYAKLRDGWGKDAPAKMFRFLQIQALVSVPLIMSVAVAAWSPAADLRVQDFLALTLILIAISGEGIADRQMQAFRTNPTNRGKICDTGLWRYSRHPNYFFEWMVWLAYPLFAIDLTCQYLWGWCALAAPIVMYWLLTMVSGIPPLEDIMVEKYGALYRAYQRRTSAFFPAPPAPESLNDYADPNRAAK